jgi:hypothetical protein
MILQRIGTSGEQAGRDCWRLRGCDADDGIQRPLNLSFLRVSGRHRLLNERR